MSRVLVFLVGLFQESSRVNWGRWWKGIKGDCVFGRLVPGGEREKCFI